MPSYQGVKLTPGPHIVRFEYSVSPLRGYLLLVRSLPSLSLLLSTGAGGSVRWMEQKAPDAGHAGCLLTAPERLVSGSRLPAEFFV